MNELVKVGEYQIGQQKTHGVNARDLWKALGVKTDFNTWIKRRLKKTGFVENQDYVIFPTFGEKSEKGRPTLEYILGMDLSKHVAMLEGGDIGREVRQYFVECEKKVLGEPVTTKQIVAEMYPPLAPAQKQGSLVAQVEMLLAVVKQQEAIEQQQIKQQNEIQATKKLAKEAVEIASGDTGFCTVLGYARRLGVHLPLPQAQSIGRTLAKYSRENKLPVGQCPDGRHGYVGQYLNEALELHEYLFFQPHQ